MTDLALHGRFFPRVEEIVRRSSRSIDRQTPDLPGLAKTGMEKSTDLVSALNSRNKSGSVFPRIRHAKRFLPLVCPVGSGAVWREPLYVCISVKGFSS